MDILHVSHFDVKKVEEHYSEKDGVPVKYVCTSALGGEAQSMDIYYRETPHPEFGNKYFGLYLDEYTNELMITNADKIEGVEFAMIQDKNGKYRYSAHRHDCVMVDGSMIDGGRSYIRTNGCDITMFKVIEGDLKCFTSQTIG